LTELQNQRRLPRVSVALPVHISTFTSGYTARAFLKDLTPNGIALETDCEPSPEDDLEVSLSVPYEISLEKYLTVRFRGQVVRDIRCSEGKRKGFAATLHAVRDR